MPIRPKHHQSRVTGRRSAGNMNPAPKSAKKTLLIHAKAGDIHRVALLSRMLISVAELMMSHMTTMMLLTVNAMAKRF